MSRLTLNKKLADQIKGDGDRYFNPEDIPKRKRRANAIKSQLMAKGLWDGEDNDKPKIKETTK